MAVRSPVVTDGAGTELPHAEMQWAHPEATSERSTEVRDIAETYAGTDISDRGIGAQQELASSLEP